MYFDALKSTFVLFNDKNVVGQRLIKIVDFIDADIFGLDDIFPKFFIHSCDKVHVLVFLAVLDDDWF
jgi:hypothetical protein